MQRWRNNCLLRNKLAIQCSTTVLNMTCIGRVSRDHKTTTKSRKHCLYLFCNIGMTRILMIKFDLPTMEVPTAFINVMVTGGNVFPPCITELFARVGDKTAICAAGPWPLMLMTMGMVVLKKADETPILMLPLRVARVLHHEMVPLQSETPFVDPYRE